MVELTEALSDRERQIVRLGAHGLTDKEIAERLSVSITTVRTYWIRLRRKLSASNRAQAIARAMLGLDSCHLKQALIHLGDQPWLAVAVLDAQGTVLDANAAFRSLVGDRVPAAIARSSKAMETPRWIEVTGANEQPRKLLISVVPLSPDGQLRAAYLIPA